MEHAKKLPDGWIKVKSKSKAGKFYFYNNILKASVWKIEDAKNYKTNDQAISNKKTHKKAPPKALLNPPLTTAASSKAIKKNVAKDRLENLQKKLKAEVKVARAKEGTNDSKSGSPKKPTKHLDLVINLDGLKDVVKLREEKFPKNVVKNGALQRMARIRKQQSDLQEPSNKKKEENNNSVEHEAHKTEPKSDVVMMDISFEDLDPQAISEYESMEWEDIPEQEVIQHAQKARHTVNSEAVAPVLPKSSLPIASNIEFFVVVDTNVLLSNIDFLKQIKGKIFKDIGKATIYLPYIVLRELDHLKSNQSVERQARRAIAFIDDCFKSRDAFVLGQSAVENHQRKIIPIDGGDDEILNCCLILQEKTKKIVLLTNDKNLRNKAFVNKLEGYSRDMLYSTDFNIKNQIKFE